MREWARSKHSIVVRLVAVLALTAAACGDDDDPTGVDLAGTWHLETVNGTTLPVTVIDLGATYRLELLSGRLTLTGSSFQDITSWRETENGNVTMSADTVNGTWTRSGNDLTFTFGDGEGGSETLRGTIASGALRITTDGQVIVYRKPASASGYNLNR